MSRGELKMIRLIADTIKDAGADGIPSGMLYSALMNNFSSVDAYQSFVDMLKRAGLVSETGHVLRFIA